MTSHPQSFFIFSGEPSGDILAGELTRALSSQGTVDVEGVCGPHGQAAGIRPYLGIDEFTMMGFSEVLRKLPFIAKALPSIRKRILKTQPDAVVLIDHSGFTLRLAKSLRMHGYRGKLIQYVCPTVWAWRTARVHTLRRCYDLTLCLYPFEPAFLQRYQVPARFVGHPSAASIRTHAHHTNALWTHGLDPHRPILALFPGSRVSEVRMCLPRMLETALALQRKIPNLQCALSVARDSLHSVIREMTDSVPSAGKIPWIPSELRFELMQTARAAIAASGTVCLELGLHQLPSVVVYDINRFNYLIARWIARLNLDFYCNVNIIVKKEVFPEKLAHEFSPPQVLQALELLWKDGAKRQNCLDGCGELCQRLGQDDPSQQAAQAIQALFSPQTLPHHSQEPPQHSTR